jgi:hypothetical protein
MRRRELLVAVEHYHGVAGVVREGRHLVLIDDVEDGGGAVLDDLRPAIVGLRGDRTLQGGRLPPGAVAAEVVDHSGARCAAAAANGVWAVVLDHATRGGASPVRFSDADGATVAVPLPAGWPRTPVDDAREPCPACGATGWDEVRPRDGSFGMQSVGGSPATPSPLVVCRTCGHTETVPTFYGPAVPESAIAAPPPWPSRERLHFALHDVHFPVYAVRGRPARLSGWGTRNGTPSQLTIVDGQPAIVSVETALAHEALYGEPATARQALEDVERHGDWPERSPAGLAIWLGTRDRERQRVAATARVDVRPLEVDGEPMAFAVAAAKTAWAAVRRHGDVQLTVTSDGVALEDVALERVRVEDLTAL